MSRVVLTGDRLCFACYRSQEGDYHCARFGGWREACPLEKMYENENDGSEVKDEAN